MAQEFKPKLVLLSLYMAGLGGEELAKEIIKGPKLWNTKIVFLIWIITSQKAGANGRQSGAICLLPSKLMLAFL